MKMTFRFLLLLHLAALCWGPPSPAQTHPVRLARAIADRVIRETDLSLRPVPFRPAAGVQVLDFLSMFGRNPAAAAYAYSIILSGSDTVLRYGVSRDCPLRIWVNGSTVLDRASGSAMVFTDLGYETFRFNDTVTVRLRKGQNPVLLKVVLSGSKNAAYLRELCSPGDAPSGTFDLRGVVTVPAGIPWVFTGEFSRAGDPYGTVFPPEKGFSPSYSFAPGMVAWRSPSVPIVTELAIRPNAAYARESYAEWMYPNGTVLLSLLQLSKATGDPSYGDFVRRVSEFTLSNLPLFQFQYENLHALRSADYRIFRRSLLDDTGAPVLPYIQLLAGSDDPRLRALVDTMAAYVSAGQLRLPDGTLCRYEPTRGTVWADDLFMSVPFLLRLGELSGASRYFDDAVRQIVNFNRYLRDTSTGLYRHGYYPSRGQQSLFAWGRANGWVVWAHAEALLYLPKSHPGYRDVAEIFVRQMEAIVRVQGRSGLWHQLLERPDSFEETSCTAMFMIGLARGMRLGVLDGTYRAPLGKALKGLQSRISDDGIVKDICRGTGMSEDPSFYMARERFDNDPRGLGAVITALIEAEEFDR